MKTATPAKSLRDIYAGRSSKIRRAFQRSWDGVVAVRARAELVDDVTGRLWEEFAGGAARRNGFCLIARGGYGHSTLFPHSDVDLLFLVEHESMQRECGAAISRICQELWDLGIRVGPTTRTLTGCARFDADNLEFIPSLIGSRYLCGDHDLFHRFHNETLPKLIHREWQAIVQQLLELTEARHRKYGNTLFHLEPNVKECPGGLRDFDIGRWLHVLSAFRRGTRWPDERSPAVRDECGDAVAFLTAVRCFLHYHHGRDDNVLTWQDQDKAATERIHANAQEIAGAAEWMRTYYRCARRIERWTGQLLDEVPPARSSMYLQFTRWRSRLSNADFSVVGERVHLQQSTAAADPDVVLRLFEFIALHGLMLARDTERRIEQGLSAVVERLPKGSELWSHLRQILIAPHAAQALRELHALGLLKWMVPEFSLIDALVVRDFYHRYTVDEHSFLAIETLHRLNDAKTNGAPRFTELLSEVEEPELLFLTLLLHDIGKAQAGVSHLESSTRFAQQCLARLHLSNPQVETVEFLVANHLEMSAALRRDIFDSETIRSFADKVNSPELLKMLTLLTYADIRAVNPEALTAWKADNLWHLYVGTLNHLNRAVEEAAATSSLDDRFIRRAASLVPREMDELESFLDGLPRRYVRLHSAEEIVAHFRMASSLEKDPVQLALDFRRDLFELTVVTRERPGLFACIAGALTAWGVDIVKAAAYSNASGVVVDTLVFRDRFRNLELNPPERIRFQQNVTAAIAGEVDLTQQIQSRIEVGKILPVKRRIEPRVLFDNESSSHSTVLEIVAQDRPGLLYGIASMFARLKCNIEVALIETEGPMAIDVFYVTRNQRKLDASTQELIGSTLTSSNSIPV